MRLLLFRFVSYESFEAPPNRTSSEAGGPVVGFIAAVAIVPMVYAILGHLLASRGLLPWPPDRPLEFAALCGIPPLIGGYVQWRDVWMEPAPKMGADWAPLPPGQYLSGLFVVHASVVAITLCCLAYTETNPERNQQLSELFRVRWAIKQAPLAPEADKLAHGELEQLRTRERELLEALGLIKPREGPAAALKGEDPEYIWRFILKPYAGFLVFLPMLAWSLSTPRRAGFHSGQPIQH